LAAPFFTGEKGVCYHFRYTGALPAFGFFGFHLAEIQAALEGGEAIDADLAK
jgi:hypothetical protein